MKRQNTISNWSSNNKNKNNKCVPRSESYCGPIVSSWGKRSAPFESKSKMDAHSCELHSSRTLASVSVAVASSVVIRTRSRFSRPPFDRCQYLFLFFFWKSQNNKTWGGCQWRHNVGPNDFVGFQILHKRTQRIRQHTLIDCWQRIQQSRIDNHHAWRGCQRYETRF